MKIEFVFSFLENIDVFCDCFVVDFDNVMLYIDVV